jgi:hypothetical protein
MKKNLLVMIYEIIKVVDQLHIFVVDIFQEFVHVELIYFLLMKFFQKNQNFFLHLDYLELN